MKFVELKISNGGRRVLVNPEAVAQLSDHENNTVGVTRTDGGNFEVSGSLDEVRKKLEG